MACDGRLKGVTVDGEKQQTILKVPQELQKAISIIQADKKEATRHRTWVTFALMGTPARGSATPESDPVPRDGDRWMGRVPQRTLPLCPHFVPKFWD